MGLCPVSLIFCAGFSHDPLLNTPTLPFLPSSAPQGSAPMSSCQLAGRVRRVGWPEGEIICSLLGECGWIPHEWNPGSPKDGPAALPWQGHPCLPCCLSVCSTCCPRRPSRLCGNRLLTCGCGSPTRWGCQVGWVGTFCEPKRPEEPFETVCRVSSPFLHLTLYIFSFPYHTRNAVLLPSRCQVDYAAYHILAPLYLLFNLFLVKSLNWCTVITATWVLPCHFIWTNQSPVKCVLKHIINTSTQINKTAGRGAGIDSHPFSWGFFLQLVLKRLQGCIQSQLVSPYSFIFFLF